MTRRSLFQIILGGISALFVSKSSKTAKKSQELYHYKANDGFMAKVFLDGEENINVTELMGAAEPGVEVDGCVKLISQYSNGKWILIKRKVHQYTLREEPEILMEWKSGKVRWELL